jgi:transposase
MPLKPQEDLGVPDETRRVAMAAFPKGCACLRIGDVLGCVYQDKQFESLFPRRGRPAQHAAAAVQGNGFFNRLVS